MKGDSSSGPGSSIAIIIILVLMILGFVYVLKDKGADTAPGSTPIGTSTAPSAGTPPSTDAPATTTFPSYYGDPSTWQSTSITSGGFSIKYPPDFPVTNTPAAAAGTDWRLDANGTTGMKYLIIKVPQDFEPQTNFSDATLTVGRSPDPSALSTCLIASNGETEAGGTVFINSIEFSVFSSNDAGAGNLYDTTSYRTVHDGQCFAVEYTIHSTQLSNYPTSDDLVQFDMDKVQSTLDLIVSTFNFL